MESNIQSLLDKIYEEGIQKSKSESEKILSEARREADSLISSAKVESLRIMEKAKKDSQVIKESTEADLKSAKNQTLSSLQSELTNLIIKKSVEPSIKEASLDVAFLKTIILKITENWIQSDNKAGITADQIELLIPEEKKSEFEQSLQSVISGKLDGLKLTGSSIKSGFQIIRKDKGYKLDFTDDAMKEFFKSFLRQKTAEWLFKE
jgi:V/A-type H+/Na+-transporting ATPase subunit E